MQPARWVIYTHAKCIYCRLGSTDWSDIFHSSLSHAAQPIGWITRSIHHRSAFFPWHTLGIARTRICCGLYRILFSHFSFFSHYYIVNNTLTLYPYSLFFGSSSSFFHENRWSWPFESVVRWIAQYVTVLKRDLFFWIGITITYLSLSLSISHSSVVGRLSFKNL